ncbi:MAG: DNA polymerase III subunit alpha [Hyphomicrobiaceae bacterium]|nr:DNA polymerase III subunit alpha [Hyphomicrobiaceae bacterium]
MNAPIRRPDTAAPASNTPRAGASFVHLKVHSAYSLLEGALPIGKLAGLCQGLGYPAVALTDTNNLFGILEFSDKLSGAGIQPIAGVTLAIDLEAKTRVRAGGPAPADALARRDGTIALYAMSERGYANLLKLVSRAHLQAGENEGPHITMSQLRAASEDLIVLTGGPDGPIDRALSAGQMPLARARLATLAKLCGDRLYVELQRHGLEHEVTTEPQLVELAYALGLPIVATNEAYFASPEDHEAHDALLSIAEGRYIVEDDRRRVSPDHCFKGAEEMAALFRDLPEALDNTIEIARRCPFCPKGRKPILPRFVAVGEGASEADQLEAEAAELEKQAREGLKARLAATARAPGFTEDDYWKRLAFEVDIITRMKFPGYFLIVADFIKWAKGKGIPVGPGRGSGAGSVVAWALTITDLDPLRFGLLFERFLNPERVSMPDFDIDFCQDRRDEVIRYVQGKYGADRVAQIITHGKLQARAVLRDVGRVLQMPYGQVDKLCKLVPNNPANPVSLPDAIASEPKLQEARDSEPLVARLLEIAQKLEGLYRHASTHAAGMVIGDRPLDELVPLYRDPKSSFPITQFNWKQVEKAGLVKFDFLGLKTLTVLKKAVDLIAQCRGVTIDLASVPLDDRPSYEMLARADTVGVFQLESSGMRESLKRLKPDRFEDIIAMVALYRPGPMDNIPVYINRKHGEEPVDCLHPMLEPILKETYGVIIYQEQVMQIAQVLAGYSLGEADLLRRAMGKKDKAEMAKQQARFVDGALRNGVARKDAVYIFELVDKFAGYGFNKSHAAAYALVSYHTAYLKANFREEFLAASMTLDMGNTDKLSVFAAEARRSGIAVKPPCVNTSAVDFLPEPSRDEGQPGAIRYSLAALKNIGAGAVESIAATRAGGGRFKDLADFAGRVNVKALNKRAIETLAAAGAFDALEPDRALAYGNVDQVMALAQRLASDAASGITDLFGGGSASAPQLDLRPASPWTPMERLEKELEAIGFFLSGHPLDQYESVLAALGAQSWAELEAATERGATAGRLAGVVVSARERKSQRGNKFAFAMFSDASGQFEAVIFSDTLAQARDLLEPGTPVLLTVEAEREGDSVKMRVQSLEALDKAAGAVQRGLRLVLGGDAVLARRSEIAGIRELLKPGCGEIRLVLKLDEKGREVELTMPGRYEVGPMVRGTLSTVPGVLEVVDL